MPGAVLAGKQLTTTAGKNIINVYEKGREGAKTLAAAYREEPVGARLGRQFAQATPEPPANQTGRKRGVNAAEWR